MEKKVRKISLSTMLLIIALIVIIIMGYYIYKLSRVQEADKQIIEGIEGIVSENINGAVGKIENVKNTKTNILTAEKFKSYIEGHGFNVYDASSVIPDSKMKDGLKIGYLTEKNDMNDFRINYYEFNDEYITMYIYYDQILSTKEENIGELIETNETEKNYSKYVAIFNGNYEVMIRIDNTLIWGIISEENKDILDNTLQELGY